MSTPRGPLFWTLVIASAVVGSCCLLSMSVVALGALIEEDQREAVGKMKQFATYFTHGVRNGAKLRTEIYKMNDAVGILDMVDAFFGQELAAA